MITTTLCYIEKDGKYLMLHRVKKHNDINEGKWIGVGGKLEPGESPDECVKREILEELDTEIAIGELVETIEYDYPTFHLSMDCFWAEIISGKIVLKEAESAKWLIRDELDSIQWLPVDESLIEKIGAALQFAWKDGE